MPPKRTSIKDVAAAAGVSIGTVSNVLNRPDAVADDTRRRVLATIQRLGYVRNESARQLRAGHSRTIGLLVLDVANPYFMDVAAGVEETTDERGHLLTLCNSGEDRDREDNHLDNLLEQRVRGLLVTPVDADNPRLERFAERGIPVVLVDRGAGDRDLCSVAVDDVRGGQIAGEHLTALGHEHVGFVGGPMSIRQVADRLDGFRQAVGDRAVTVVETRSLTIPAGSAAGGDLFGLTRRDRPTAVFCANDLLALGILQQAVMRGLSVPDDIAIIGYDDISYAAGAAVPLSSIRQPREELGRAAAGLLFDEIADGDRHHHRQVVFQPELVARRSTTGT